MMHKKRQIYATIAGLLFFLICTARVALAEDGVPPVATTPEPGTTITAGPELSAPAPSPEPTPALDSSAVDGVVVDASIVDQETPAEQPQPEEETWRPVIDALRPGYWEASILPVQGMAMYYNPGVFEQVLDFRFKNNHITPCDECIGHVALLRGGDINRRVWLQRENQRMEGPFWVVDAAAFKHIPTLLSRNWVIDVDHNTAMRWRMSGPIPITIYDADSPEAQAAAAAQESAAQTYAFVGFVYKCAILPLESHDYQVLDALRDSMTCLASTQPTAGDPDSANADNTND